jgi:hypothetical protein
MRTCRFTLCQNREQGPRASISRGVLDATGSSDFAYPL